jgi:SMC interacting uncharacterized protein involved in chromosome segregation
MALSRAAYEAEKALADKAADWQGAMASVKNELEKADAEISAYLDRKSSSPQSIAVPTVK